MDFPVGARILHPLINFVTASIPPFFSLLLIQGFTPFHKLLDSSLPLSFLPLGNGDKSVYGFCDFLILFFRIRLFMVGVLLQIAFADFVVVKYFVRLHKGGSAP